MKYIQPFLLCICVLFSVVTCYGQEFYYVKNSTLYTYDVVDCESTFLYSFDEGIGPITFTPEGELYCWLGTENALYQIDLTTYDLNHIVDLECNVSSCEIVADDTGHIYIISTEDMCSYDLNTGEEVNYPNYNYLGKAAAYSNGKIYFATMLGGGIYELNPEEPENSTLLYELPYLWGTEDLVTQSLVAIPVSCDSTAFFMTFLDGLNNPYIHYVDPFTPNSLVEVCVPPYIIGATSSPLEYWEPECIVELDLDIDDSSGGLIYNYQVDTSCVSGGVEVSDIDVSIEVEGGFVDSIEVFISNPLGFGEVLLAPNVAGVNVVGNNSEYLQLQNQGGTDIDAFEALIPQLMYQNTQYPLVEGVREIGFVLWSADRMSDTAWAYIPIFNETASAGENIDVEVCETENTVDLFDYINGELGGNWWYNENVVSSEVDPSNGTTGEYLYIQTGVGDCLADTAIANVIIYDNPIFTLGEDMLLCEGETVVLSSSTIGSHYFWQDGSEGATYEVNEAGVYWLELENTGGCVARDSIIVEYANTSTSDEEIMKCEGEVFTYNGQTYMDDATIVATYSNELGCDSTHTINLSFTTTLSSLIEESICEGESYIFEGIELTSDTSYCETYISSSGCDSLVCLELETVSLPFVDLGEDILLLPNESRVIVAGVGNHYLWSTGDEAPSILVVESGTYSVTVTNENGCTASDEIEVTVLEESEYFIPNVFSPNDDGINDYFTVLGNSEDINIKQIEVFDRWGGLVYSNGEIPVGIPYLGWNGRQGDETANVGVYVYIIKLVWKTGREERVSGTVTLLE